MAYIFGSGKVYDFNTADKLNEFFVNALITTGDLKTGEEYDIDFGHQFIETEKYATKPAYKRFLGYCAAVACIDDKIVNIEGMMAMSMFASIR